jgi:hypothetical protein
LYSATYVYFIPSTPGESSQWFSGKLLLFENGTKKTPADDELRNCTAIATVSLDVLIGDVVKIAKPLIQSELGVDINLFPPFSIYLIYKTAAILTDSLRPDDMPAKKLQRLKTLRQVLRTVSQRWLSAGKNINSWNFTCTAKYT